MNGLIVHCYSGYTYAEKPESFQWQGTEYEVEEIIKEWLEPGEKYFKIRTGITNCSNSAIMRQTNSGR